MTDRVATDRFPPLPLAAAATLVIAALAATLMARTWDIGKTKLNYGEPASTRDLRFEDRADGAIAVVSHDSGEMVELITPGNKGFVRMVMRGLARDRQTQGLGPEQPFTLTRWTNGRLTISDATTARQIELSGFGKDNVNAFAKLLLAGSDAK